MNKNIKVISYIFSFLFFLIISTLVYFLVFRSNYYANHVLNKRITEDRNKYLRGKILDRDGNIIAYTSEEDKKRVYPYGEVLFHPLGYFDIKYGVCGIEKEMDEYLKKPNGLISNLNIFLNKNEKYGSDVKLTLNTELQQYAYSLLGDKKGSVVLMNPKTGEIYALVSKPSIDPNNLNNIWDIVSKDSNAPLYNRAINGKYPPGSIFKIITSAASIENIEGVSDKIFHDNGFIDFNGVEKLYNQNKKAYGDINLKDAFVDSSNVVFGELSLDLGNDRLRRYSERFYFNKSMNIKGLNVSKSYFPKLNSYEKGLIAQSGIGQGQVLATPIMMAMIASSIANNGVLKNPYIVSEVLNYEGNIINKTKSKTLLRVMSKKISKTITEYMKEVVSENLSNIRDFNGIKAAGKTGTADHKKGDIDGIPHSVFVGFAPYDNPKVAIATIVEEGGEGRGIASEISAKVLNKALLLIK